MKKKYADKIVHDSVHLIAMPDRNMLFMIFGDSGDEEIIAVTAQIAANMADGLEGLSQMLMREDNMKEKPEETPKAVSPEGLFHPALDIVTTDVQLLNPDDLKKFLHSIRN
jgi:hypothetical protein